MKFGQLIEYNMGNIFLKKSFIDTETKIQTLAFTYIKLF